MHVGADHMTQTQFIAYRDQILKELDDALIGPIGPYLVLDLSVNDFGGFKRYIAEIPAFIAKHSGKYIVQGVRPTTIEGGWTPERMVIIEFPERKKAEAFLSDPDIQDLFELRHDTTTSKLVLVDGCT